MSENQFKKGEDKNRHNQKILPSDNQLEFIRSNAPRMTLQEMSRAQGVSENTIHVWMKENGIPKRNIRGPQKKLVHYVKPGMFNPNEKFF